VRQWLRACEAHDLVIERATAVLCAEIAAENIVAWGQPGVWRTRRFTRGIHEALPSVFFANPHNTIQCDGWATRGWDTSAQHWANWNGPDWGDVRFRRDNVLKLWPRDDNDTIRINADAQAITVLPDDRRRSTPESRGVLAASLQFDSGYISRRFITDDREKTAELLDSYILLHEEKLSALMPILSLLEAVVQSGKSLLIVALDVEGELLATLVLNKMRGGLKVAAVRAPGFGDCREAIMDDIATFTGGTVFNHSLGVRVESATLAKLGTAAKVVIGKSKTTIFDGGGKSIESSHAASTESDQPSGRVPDAVPVLNFLPEGTVLTNSGIELPVTFVPRQSHKAGSTKRRKSPREQLTDALIQIHRDGEDISHGNLDELHSLALAKARFGFRSRGNSRSTFERALAAAIKKIDAR
jgi:hypothetical protein